MKHYQSWRAYPLDQWRWDDFEPREMACKGTGQLGIDTEAMDKLQELRDLLGKPLVITSAYRSPSHNRAVGGASKSQHLKAKAFDIRMDNHAPHKFERAARSVGFTGFGYYPKNGFMHIDTGPARSWGTPWPKETPTTYPEEPKRVPEKVTEDREAQAAAGAGVSGGVAVAIDAMPAAGGLLGGLAPTAQTIAIAVAGLFIAYMIWRRVK